MHGTDIYDDFTFGFRLRGAHLCADEDDASDACSVLMPAAAAVTSWSTHIANKNVRSASSRPFWRYYDDAGSVHIRIRLRTIRVTWQHHATLAPVLSLVGL